MVEMGILAQRSCDSSPRAVHDGLPAGGEHPGHGRDAHPYTQAVCDRAFRAANELGIKTMAISLRATESTLPELLARRKFYYPA